MSTPGDRRGFAWEQTERLMPVADLIPTYKKIRGSVNAGVPIILTDDGARVAVVMGWDLWTLQNERYLSAAALSWACWRTGKFDAGAFGWDVLGLLRPPMMDRLHPTVQPGEDGSPDVPVR
jgi:hypothetical protein